MLIRKGKNSHLHQQEAAYMSVRAKESRIYADELVQSLPEILKSHPHAQEWKIRKASLKRITEFLKQKPKVQKVMDLGCGNGWLTHQIHKLGYKVTGVDINVLELEQANRVFPDCTFIEMDIFNDSLPDTYDAIIISAALQYFREPEVLVHALKRNALAKDGCILISDTFFYPPEKLEKARLRSKLYFERNFSEEMNQHYFHHSLETLRELGALEVGKATMLQRILAKMGGTHNPFSLYVIHAENADTHL